MTSPARLVLQTITKRYPAVLANDDISLAVAAGSIHAVLGENGAGKSTLMKIIYGAVKPDRGQVLFDGNAVQIANPQAARSLGISMVFQHFSLFDTLSVAENVWLGLDQSLSLKDVTAQITQKAAVYGLDIDPLRPVHTLAVGERQRVEIIRALLTNPKLLILDEPTSVLTPQAVEKLFIVLRKLASEGCAILYISHKLDEIRALCDACTVLRAGRVTGECVPSAQTNASLARMMIGFEPRALARDAMQTGESRLVIQHFSEPKSDPFGIDLNAINLDVRAGEVVGIAGVSGNGQKELLAAISTRQFSGTYKLHIVPEERLGCGAVPSMSLADNLLLTRSEAITRRLGMEWIAPKKLHEQATRIIHAFNVKAGSGKGSAALAQSLSGGNLQKFIVGREMDANPQVLVVAQPTWGVDVGAAAQIRGELLALRAKGCAVLVISDELDELFEVCDRLHVIAKGRLSPSMSALEATPSLVGEWMSGLWEAPPVIPATTPVIPATAPVIPATTPVIPATTPVIPATTPVIPAKAGIHGNDLTNA
ncbi:MAG: ABC transporter ATP-binding protein [Cytophagales bacterium]|nr:ABC transporter ATP-binding protein [Cytophagales bacterium]